MDYNMEKYFSNGNVERQKTNDAYDDEEDDDEDGYQRPTKKGVKIPDRYLQDYSEDKEDGIDDI